MEDIKVVMKIDKETKNAIRYATVNDGKPPAVETMYVKKWALGDSAPQQITVTVTS